MASSPADGSSEAPTNARISVLFDDMMLEESFSGNVLLIGPDDLSVPGALGPNADGIQAFTSFVGGPYTATFEPSVELEPNTTYTAIVTSHVADTSGNEMGEDYVWSFTTGDTTDTIAPKVESTLPEDGAVHVPSDTTLIVRFTEEMDVASLTSPGLPYRLESYDGLDAVFLPYEVLALNTTHRFTVSSARDLAGNSIGTSYTWAFTTN
jgi:hypothetical protein